MVKNVGVTTLPCYIQINVITRCVIKGLHCRREKWVLLQQGSYRQVCVKFKDFYKTFLQFSTTENL